MKCDLLNFYKETFTFIKENFLFTDIQRKNHEDMRKKILKNFKIKIFALKLIISLLIKI